jgi:hypothetical protein
MWKGSHRFEPNKQIRNQFKLNKLKNKMKIQLQWKRHNISPEDKVTGRGRLMISNKTKNYTLKYCSFLLKGQGHSNRHAPLVTVDDIPTSLCNNKGNY